MKSYYKKLLYWLSISALFTASVSAHAADYVPGEILVKFKSNASKQTKDFSLRSTQAVVQQKFSKFKLEHWRLPQGMDVLTAVAELNKDPNVEFAEPNYRRTPSAIPNDPSFTEQWALQNTGQVVNFVPAGVIGADMGLVTAWNTTTGSANVIVAVIDDSVDINHEDLYANIWANPGEIAGDGIDNDGNGYTDDVHGWDFVNFDNDPSADFLTQEGHGTMVSGCIGAMGNNGIGISGVNQTVSIMPLKFGLDVATELSAIQYAIDNGAHIINMSFGGFSGSIAEANAMDNLEAAGILVVAAAGNSDFNNDMLPSYPASYPNPNIISVAASTPTDTLTPWTQYGVTSVDIAAPGQDIYTTTSVTTWGAPYGFVDGTSFSSPYVAGIAALVKAQYPTATAQELKGRILAGSTPLPSMQDFVASGGRASADGALTAVAAPVILIKDVVLSDGNNGWPEPGETLTLDFVLENNWVSAPGVQATLTSLSSNVSVGRSLADYAAISTGTAKGAAIPFPVTIAANATGHQVYKFKLDITDNGGYAVTRYYQIALGNLNVGETHNGTIQKIDQDDTQYFHVTIPDTGYPITFSTTSGQDIDLIVTPVSQIEPGFINSGTQASISVTGNESISINAPASEYYVFIDNFSKVATLPYTITVESLVPVPEPKPDPTPGGGCFAPIVNIGMLPMLFLLGLLFWVSRRKRI